MRASLPLLFVVTACSGSDPVELSDPSSSLDPDGTGLTVDEPDPTVPPTTSEACVPSQAAFEANALPAIQRNCALCHGATPDFGAPMSLLDYEALVAGAPGQRVADVMVDVLMAGTMPPPNQGLMPHADLDTLVGWASCGLLHPDPSAGLEASRDVWEAPADAPPGAVPIDLSADGHPVGPNDIDAYEYFNFRNLVDDDVFIRRIEAVIDESRVVHHITLNHDLLGGFAYLYTWAPGTGAIEFPDGGIRLRRNDTLVMNIHYNNGAGIENVRDSSGIRLWVDEPVGTEWAMAAPSVWDIDIPANSVGAEATNTCRATRDFQILAGMPHMHELGSEFRHVLERADGTEETLIELTGWSFEAQYFYEMPVTVRQGDTLRLTCTYDNPSGRDVSWGEGTQDEMCFDFIYVTPAEAAFQCLL